MKIKCFGCEKSYIPNQSNTKIYGPYMETNCPFCMYKWEGKMLNFVEEQVGGRITMSAHCAIEMQVIAQYIELNSSDYYKKRKRKHGKKRKES